MSKKQKDRNLPEYLSLTFIFFYSTWYFIFLETLEFSKLRLATLNQLNHCQALFTRSYKFNNEGYFDLSLPLAACKILAPIMALYNVVC